MKKLHLIRHAKSSWKNNLLADIDRPLNQRGLDACKIMAEEMVKAGCPFEPVFCSVATRAQSTIEQLDEALPDRELSWQVERDLYTFSSQDLLTWCQAVNNDLSEAVIVGHNSALTELVNYVGNRPIENLPTCGYVQLSFDISDWAEISADSAELISFLKPKMFSS